MVRHPSPAPTCAITIPRHRHRRRLHIERAACQLARLPPASPAGEHVCEEASRHRREALPHRADPAEDPAQDGAVEESLGSPVAAVVSSLPRSARSVPSPIAGTMSVPRSIASTCMTTSGSGIAPPVTPHTKKGTELTDVRAEVVAGETTDVVVHRPGPLRRRRRSGEVASISTNVGQLTEPARSPRSPIPTPTSAAPAAPDRH